MAIQREGYFNGCKPMGLLRIHLFALKTRFLGPDVSSSGLSWRQKMEWVGWSRIWGERRERVRGSPDFWPGVADRRPKTAPAVRRSKTSGVCWVASTADRRSLQWPLIKSVLTVGARRQGQGGGGGGGETGRWDFTSERAVAALSGRRPSVAWSAATAIGPAATGHPQASDSFFLFYDVLIH